MESVGPGRRHGQLSRSASSPAPTRTWPRWTCRTAWRAPSPRLPAVVTQQGCGSTSRAPTSLAPGVPVLLGPRHRHRDAERLRCTQRVAGSCSVSRHRPGPTVRLRAGHAHLDRSGQAAGLQLCSGGRECRHPGAERPGCQRRRWAVCPTSPGQGITATVVVQWPAHERRAILATSCCAPTPMAPPCACKDVARVELGSQAYATSARLNGKPCRGHRACSCPPRATRWPAAKAVRATRWHELAAASSRRRGLDDPLRQLALRQDLHQPGGQDAAGSRRAGVPGDVPVPAELALHPDSRPSWCRWRCWAPLPRCWRWASRSTC